LLLEEANQLDPTNTEVLLHMAELLIELTPDDPTDEQRLLYRVKQLLREPKDQAEQFRLAQATFLYATTSDPIRFNELSEARELFAKLGKATWVKHCDELLRSTHEGGSVSSPSQPDNPPWLQPSSPPPTQQAPVLQQVFQPVGRWMVQVGDAVGSTMTLNLAPNGGFEAEQQAGLGISIKGAGQWVFVPQQRMLQLQGLIGGFQPFMLGITIQAQQNNGYYGVGSDGYGYFLVRA